MMGRSRIAVALIATALALSGCGKDNDEQAAPAPAPSPSLSPSRSPSPTPSASPSATGTVRETAAVKAAFAPIRGYAYVAAPPETDRQVRTAISRDREANRILRGFGIRTVTQGSVPVASVQVYEFERGTPPAVKSQFAQGVQQSVDAKPRVVRLGGKDASYFVNKETGVKAVLYFTPGTVGFAISGLDVEDVRRVAGALIAATS